MSPKLLNILLILIPVVLYYGYIDPMTSGNPGLIWTPEKTIARLQSDNVQYANALDQITFIEDNVGDRVGLSHDYKAIDDATKQKMSTLLPDSIDSVSLRGEITAIAAKSNIAVGQITVKENIRETMPLVGSYFVSFSTKAPYSDFKNFIANYEKNERLFIPVSLSIARQQKQTNTGTPIDITNPDDLNIGVTSKVYYLK